MPSSKRKRMSPERGSPPKKAPHTVKKAGESKRRRPPKRTAGSMMDLLNRAGLSDSDEESLWDTFKPTGWVRSVSGTGKMQRTIDGTHLEVHSVLCPIGPPRSHTAISVCLTTFY